MFANFAGMSPQEIEQLAKLSTMPEQLDNVNQDYGNAYDQTQMEGPQGRMAGRTYIAQNPLEQIGDIWQKKNAVNKMHSAALRRSDIYRQQEMVRQMMMNKIGGLSDPGMDPTQQGYDQTRNALRGNGMI